jgi:hypothetical protein
VAEDTQKGKAEQVGEVQFLQKVLVRNDVSFQVELDEDEIYTQNQINGTYHHLYQLSDE